MGFLQNKRILVVGVASDRSIAWGIAEAMHQQGAELAFTYQNEKLQDRVTKLAASVDSELVFPCDVSSDEQIESVFSELSKHWTDGIDGIVHAVAFAPREELAGSFVDNTTREGFRTSHEISAYSFVALARYGREMLRQRQGSLITLTYLGGERALPNYNVMGAAKASLEATTRYMAADLGPEGIRVNAISAGPIRTLAASGIGSFKQMMSFNEQASPLRKNVSTEEVGHVGAFLCSDLASGITGEVVHVDGGFHCVALSGAEL
ncbi:MAG: enoyl-ACP reductase [Halorhodospira halophila]|uniref:enoyl-ACP reductase FabI n=1 Tax=Halorhodospira TaxID=85108 RepID=UPI0019120012|nr:MULTISPECIES: enoyl-ACP reductase [Halorhodospira]MBK5942919.1 enoyl-[acyl-carrier-protein] reductase [Halorhodospira halophila]MCC3752041.1 enoyl-ACP reductase [Halorhodospira halophila]MCG5528613.1 enoyl-ACP reductase [Halorhodospira halophila]MCG5534182.1 enoyl-ACP reductase [Halorhodospira sp. 9621]MCG5541483.1 enoyl-ACP reductase [Halorhodospira sp. M39old]